MNGQSTYVSVLLTVFVLLAAAGLYFVVDSHSIAKQQAARAEKAFDRLTTLLEQRPAAPAAASPAVPGVGVGMNANADAGLDKVERTALSFPLDAARIGEIRAVLNAGAPGRGGQIIFLPDAAGRAALASVPSAWAAEAENLLAPFAAPHQPSFPPPPPSPSAGNAAGSGGGGFANDAYRDSDAEVGDGRVSYTTAFPGNLNILIENEAFVGSIFGYCVASLAERDLMDLTRFEPVLAESWDVSEDGLVYTIRLRDTFRWHAYVDPVTRAEVPARPVSADDFVFFWEILQNKDIPCEAQRSYFGFMDGIEALDERTIRVSWREPYSLAEQTTLGLQPWPRHYYRPRGAEISDAAFAEEFITSPRNQAVVGTGPFRFSHWRRDQELVLVRDRDFGGPPPSLERLVWRLVGDTEIALLELKNERLDAIGLLPIQWRNQTPAPDFHLVTPTVETAAEDSAAFDEAKKNGTAPDGHRFEKYMYPGNVWSYIGYNMRRPVFADRAVRLAMTHLVDRPRILREVSLGLGEIISGPYLPRSPYYDPEIEPWPYDPDRAREILREAGWEDSDGDGILDRDLDGDGRRTPLTFTLIVPNGNPNSRRIAALIEQDVLAAGIRMSTKMLEWSVFLQQLDNFDYDACILAWSGGVEGDPFQIWHSSQAENVGGSNHVGYRSAEGDRLIEAGRRSVDRDGRYAIYREFHRLLHHDQPYTFLTAGTATQAIHKRYRNLRVYKGGMSVELHWVPRGLQRAP